VRPLNRDNSDQRLSHYARRDPDSSQIFLIVTNLHGANMMKDIRVNLSTESLSWQGLKNGKAKVTNRLSGSKTQETSISNALPIGDVPPMTSLYLDMSQSSEVVEK
jgi:hypothetical protein